MSDAAAAAPTQKVKTPKKKSSKPKTPSSHPKYSQMIKEAIVTLKEKSGSSRQAILHYIVKTYKVVDERTVNQHLKMALRAGVKNNSLKHAKGSGASGSFKLGEVKVVKKAKKPAAKKAKKPKAAKPKKAKKPKSPKKPKTAKPKKPKAKKSPKKAAKPKATKTVKPKAKKSKTPKKTAKK
ncbi:histone H1-delta-like [Gigantopelta aegis]|uniref:histone H1-delta-like n=1 Tax=Gigantopelta aegis TaxID=1735272 RepID=UPI001B88AD05|nr:histone H1-delta-like [Gigantopelta aegis]